MPEFPPIGHVAVTVKDLSVSRPWYRDLIGADPVLDEPTEGGFHHAVFSMGGTLLGLHEHPGTDTADTFTELRLGLDHIAFACDDRAALDQWQTRLDELGIAHGGIVDAHYGSGLSFRDPDGVALEFFAPPS
jgi:glyoxylase I family protein